MDKLKVVQITPILSPEIGGPVSVVVSTSKFLEGRYNFVQIVLGENKWSGSIRNYLDVKTFWNNRYAFVISSKLLNVIKKLKWADVVISHGFYTGNTLIALFVNPKRLIIMPHGSLEEYQWTRSKLKKEIFDRIYLWRETRGHVEFMVAAESEVISIRKRFPHSHVSVVGLGVSKPNQLKERNVDQKAETTLFSFSRIAHKKRIDNLIIATGILNLRSNRYRLKIAGDGDSVLMESLKNLALKIDNSDCIEFKGWISDSLKESAFLEVDILILPSENENFAVSVAEAIVRGVPVIISKNVALSTFVLKNKCGIVLEDLSPEKIAETVIKIELNYSDFSKNCLLTSEQLLWSSVVEDWYKLIERV